MSTEKQYHIIYVVHVYVEAGDRDTALQRGSALLIESDNVGQLHNDCELLDIEDEEDEL